MLHIPGDDIKQIKWILGGILACLIVIAVSLAPAVIPLALIAGVVYLLAMLILAISTTARGVARSLWFELSSLWRR